MNIFNDMCPLCNGKLILYNQSSERLMAYCFEGDKKATLAVKSGEKNPRSSTHLYEIEMYIHVKQIIETVDFFPFAIENIYQYGESFDMTKITSILWSWSELNGYNEIGYIPYIETLSYQEMVLKFKNLAPFL